jgi:hypothetical protein
MLSFGLVLLLTFELIGEFGFHMNNFWISFTSGRFCPLPCPIAGVTAGDHV